MRARIVNIASLALIVALGIVRIAARSSPDAVEWRAELDSSLLSHLQDTDTSSVVAVDGDDLCEPFRWQTEHEPALYAGAHFTPLAERVALVEAFKKHALYQRASKTMNWLLWHESARLFCDESKNRATHRARCSRSDRDALLDALHANFHNHYDTLREMNRVSFDTLFSERRRAQSTRARLRDTRAGSGGRSGGGGGGGGDDGVEAWNDCVRISKPSVEEFMQYVRRSEPVIIENAIDDWPALEKWSLAYFQARFGEQAVALSVVPTELGFDAVEDASLWSHHRAEHTNNNNDDYDDVAAHQILVRPAHLNATVAQFAQLLRSPYAREANYYLEYSPTSGIAGLSDDLGDLSFARYLTPRYFLNWIGGETVGKLHFDRNEVLMAMVRGKKRWVLIDPGQSERVYGGEQMATAKLEYGFIGNEHKFIRDPQNVHFMSADSARVNTMSPVDLLVPNFTRHPALANVRALRCELRAGDVLYNPSHWWHEVYSEPAEDGIAAALSVFFEPYYQRYDAKQRSFERNRFYTEHVRPEIESRRRAAAEEKRKQMSFATKNEL